MVLVAVPEYSKGALPMSMSPSLDMNDSSATNVLVDFADQNNTVSA